MLYYILVAAFIIPVIITVFAYANTGIVLYRSVDEARAMIGQVDR